MLCINSFDQWVALRADQISFVKSATLIKGPIIPSGLVHCQGILHLAITATDGKVSQRLVEYHSPIDA